MKPKLRHALLVVVVSLALQAGAHAAQAGDSCAMSWKDIQQISFDTTYSVVPQVIAEGDTIHIIWFNPYVVRDPPSTLGIFYTRSFDGALTFTPPRRLLSYDSAFGNSGRLALSGRYVYLMYLTRLDTIPWYTLVLIRSSDAGDSWGQQQRIGDYTPRAITAHDASVYIRFSYLDTAGGRFREFSGCMASHDYGESFQTVALELPRYPGDGSAGNNTLIQLGGTLHYVYSRTVPFRQAGSYEVLHTRSGDSGYTWSVPDTLSVIDGIHSRHPRIAGVDRDNLYVVWNDQKYGGDFSGTIVMRRSTNNGDSWLSEQVISQYATALFSDLSARDSLVCVIWSNEYGAGDTTLRFRFTKDAGNTWSSIEEISPGYSYAEDPTVSLAGRSAHVSWFQGREIFYRQGMFSSDCFPHGIPTAYLLYQNYPNPFNGVTSIQYAVPAGEHDVSLTVHDVLGRQVATLLQNQIQVAGTYEVKWDASDMASGVYFFHLKSNSYSETKKLILVR